MSEEREIERLEETEGKEGEVEAVTEGVAKSSLSLSPEEKYAIVRPIGEECIQEDELLELFKRKEEPRCYDGFEPSGRMHIAQGVLKALNVNRLTRCGCKFVFWIADWFAMMNDKMGGDLKKIRKVGEYMIEVWKSVGMDMSNVEFLWSSEEINKGAAQYWPLVLDIARKNNIARIKRCSTIMGRSEKDELSAAQIFYPCMQCADVFHLRADICQLGMDQRKVNMLAREYADAKKMKHKPIILSHPMMPGLKEGQEKMSKSDVTSAIFMEDSEMDVNSKIKKAFCPEGVAEKNPVLAYTQHIVLPWHGSLHVSRKEENGGDITYVDYEVLEKDYVDGKLHPGDLKPAVARAINAILTPVREHFAKDPRAKQLLATVKKYRVTR